MRNLSVINVVRQEAWPGVTDSNPSMTVDSDNSHVYCSTGGTVSAFCIDTGDEMRDIDLSNEGLCTGDTSIVDIHYRMDDMSLCIALSNGDIISWLPDDKTEYMGSIGEGIASMSWSPDGELLALFTSHTDTEPARVYLLVCHGHELEPLTDIPFSTAEFGEAEFVTVGWGKKETQFHGSEGKQAATKKETVQLGVREADDKKPRIRWIGDGRFFAVSAIDPTVGTRKIRVFTREGVLHSTSELLTGLEGALDWRPSGNLIVSSQTHKNRHDIVFFERNGLRHGEFTLPYPIDTVKVREVLWNNESNILCVWLENINDSQSQVQFWTMNNYHWYLKQSLEFVAQDSQPLTVMWDVLDASLLNMLCKNGKICRYCISWVTNSNNCIGSDHEVAVIDGNKLLMTPFRKMVVPPPMSAYSLQYSSTVKCVSFCEVRNEMAVILNSGELIVYPMSASDDRSGGGKVDAVIEAAGGTGFAVKSSTPTNSYTYKLPDSLIPHVSTVAHLTWMSADRIALIVNNNTSQSTLTVLQIDPQNQTLSIECERSVGMVISVCSSPDNRLILQYDQGAVYQYTDGECGMYTTPSGSSLMFPVPCQHIRLCTFAGQEAVVGLSQRYRLFINNLELATNCTSFTLHQDFLLLTSHSHTIRCINRTTPLNKLAELSDGKTHIFDETVRRVERGSRIVTCVADDTLVVLQMPRGNLESIHPRALVLSTVRKLLDRLMFKQAFMLMHRHRLNMNLICDHNRRAFLDNIKLFIEQVNSVTKLNQFITDIHEEDVTHTMYTAFYEQQNSITVSANKCTKVDSVCDSMINALQELETDKYLLCILTAHVRKTEPQLETALNIIKSLQENDKSRAEDALKYLMFLVDVNELFDVALGMYDFELVLMVAEKSQKDPKEYLMFLNSVKKLECDYQKYTIDRYLKRYTKALSHICKCVPEKFTELMSLVRDQKLYLEAMSILPLGSQEREEVLLAFADYLNSKKRYDEAGLMYAQAAQHEKAVECFIESGCWQQGVISLQKLSLSHNDQISSITKLAEKLKTMRKYAEAAILLETYAKQPEEAITTLIEGALWDESLRLIHKYERLDFIETDWKPALEENLQQTLSNIDSDLSDLLRFKDRFLAVLLANKSKAELIGDEFRDVDADMYSDTSSMTGVSAVSSSHSRSTGRTSKNQRKAQRKKWSLKEGSKHEDLALLDEIKKLVARIDSIRDEVRALLLALVKVDQLQKASHLQDRFSTAISSVISLIPDVWSSEVVNSSAQLTGEHSTVNSILESMAKLSGGTANPAATQAEIEVKRSPVVSTDSTWKLTMLAKLT